MDKIKIIRNGLLTGLFLQLALGPVFFFIANLVLQRSVYDGFAAVLAVIIVDLLFMLLAILGIGKLIERKEYKKPLVLISSFALIIFGIIIIQDIILSSNNDIEINSTNVITSFISAFIITISSPLTIIFFTSIFTARAIEHNYNKKQLFIFGSSIASANFLFLSATVLVFFIFKNSIPKTIIQTLNFLVGFLLVGYGFLRMVKYFKN